MTMCYINTMSCHKEKFHFVQSYSLTKGLKKFGLHGRDAADKEMKQLHKRVVFEPIRVEELTNLENDAQWEAKFSWLKRVLKAELVPMDVLNENI